jgi:hypothetical protein
MLIGMKQETIAKGWVNACRPRQSGKKRLAPGQTLNIIGERFQMIYMLGTGIILIEKLTL